MIEPGLSASQRKQILKLVDKSLKKNALNVEGPIRFKTGGDIPIVPRQLNKKTSMKKVIKTIQSLNRLIDLTVTVKGPILIGFKKAKSIPKSRLISKFKTLSPTSLSNTRGVSLTNKYKNIQIQEKPRQKYEIPKINTLTLPERNSVKYELTPPSNNKLILPLKKNRNKGVLSQIAQGIGLGFLVEKEPQKLNIRINQTQTTPKLPVSNGNISRKNTISFNPGIRVNTRQNVKQNVKQNVNANSTVKAINNAIIRTSNLIK